MYDKLFEALLALKKHNVKSMKKIKSMVKKHEKLESKLVLDEKKNNELEIYKLNFMTTIMFYWRMTKLTTERDSVLKKQKDLLNSNTKLVNKANIFKKDFNKSNSTLQCKIAGKSNHDEISENN